MVKRAEVKTNRLLLKYFSSTQTHTLNYIMPVYIGVDLGFSQRRVKGDQYIYRAFRVSGWVGLDGWMFQVEWMGG